MRFTRTLVALTCASFSACGGAVRSESHSTGSVLDAAAQAETGDELAETGTRVDAGADANGAYSGYFLASTRSPQGKGANMLDIFFAPNAPPQPRAPCASDTIVIGSCCAEVIRIGLPVPNLMPLSAGDVTVSARGALVAKLLAPDYPEVGSATWTAGDLLEVSAAGGNIARFDGDLQTPAAIAGVAPAFGPTPVNIAPVVDFRVAWTPEGRDGERMGLQIDTINPTGGATFIDCDVADSEGSVLVDAGLWEGIVPEKRGSIHLIRSILSRASGANVDVELRGESWADALADFE
jgi:hypothetical protein